MEESLNKLKNFSSRLEKLFGLTRQAAEAFDPELARVCFDKNENRLGWTGAGLGWIFNNIGAVEDVLRDAQLIRENFKYVVFCGMGGSGLSVQLVKTVFGEKYTKIYSLRTTDPKAIKEILDEMILLEGSLGKALLRTLIIPISKSGKTEETLSHKKYFEKLYSKQGINISEHMWVLTDRGSPMDTGAYTQREIQLNKRSDIGGRFTSPTTNIFLLPLAIAAPERVWAILEEARNANKITDAKADVYLRLGAFLYQMAAKLGRDKLTMFVPEQIKDLSPWAEQLIEESLGKDGKGITLFYAEGLDQGQLKPPIGNDRVFLRINLAGKKTLDELWVYLVKEGYPVFEIDIPGINSIGALMLGLQKAVAAIGYLWSICFVDQPAVEGYKNATKEVMSSLKEGEKVSVPDNWGFVSSGDVKLYYEPLVEAGVLQKDWLKEFFRKNNVKDPGEALGNLLKCLITRPDFEALEIASYAKVQKEFKGALEKFRYELFTKFLKMPSKLGEGPDKNHSYHQNIEAGRNMFFSVYFMPLLFEQPECLSYDDNLIRAQAIGTVQSMIKNKRKVTLITYNPLKEKEIDQMLSEAAGYFIEGY